MVQMFRSIWATSRNRVASLVIGPWPDLSIVRGSSKRSQANSPQFPFFVLQLLVFSSNKDLIWFGLMLSFPAQQIPVKNWGFQMSVDRRAGWAICQSFGSAVSASQVARSWRCVPHLDRNCLYYTTHPGSAKSTARSWLRSVSCFRFARKYEW